MTRSDPLGQSGLEFRNLWPLREPFAAKHFDDRLDVAVVNCVPRISFNCHIALVVSYAARGPSVPRHSVQLWAAADGGNKLNTIVSLQRAGRRLVRLPLWSNITESKQFAVISAVREFFSR
jgi:hypothetical protein